MIISNLFVRCPKTGKIRRINKSAWPRWALLFVGLAAWVWYLIRVIPKPSRAEYPCLRAAAPLRTGFLAYYAAPGGAKLSLARARSLLRATRHSWSSLFLLVLVCLILVVLVAIGSDARVPMAASGTPRG